MAKTFSKQTVNGVEYLVCDATARGNIGEIENAFLNDFNIECKPLPLLVGNWKTGYYKYTDGTYDTWQRSICTNNPIEIFADGFIAVSPDGVAIMATEYNSSGTFVAVHGQFNPNDGRQTNYIVVKATRGNKFHFSIGLFAAGSASTYLTQTYIDTIKIYPIYNVDTIPTNRIRQYVNGWKAGYYDIITGVYDTWSKTLCNDDALVVPMDCYIKVIAPSDAYVGVTEYAADGSYIGALGDMNKEDSGIVTNVVYFKATKGRKYHFALGVFESGGGNTRLNQTYLDSFYVYTSIPLSSYDLESTGDTTDRTEEIQAILNSKGACLLGPGLFCTTGLIMPDSATIEGCGDKTEMRLLSSSDTNLWTFGNQSFTQDVVKEYNDFLPAGRYLLEADVTSEDTVSTQCRFTFYTGEPYVYNRTGSGYAYIGRGTGKGAYILAKKPFKAVELYSSNSYGNSEGKAATYSNISLKRIQTAIILGSDCTVKNLLISGNEEEITVPSTNGNRNGIGYYGEGSSSTIKRGVIDGCFIRSFTGGGIDLYNTGYGTQGLNVCNCYVWNCYCGFNGVHFTEFHRVTGCSFVGNYIGIMNNGGNNQFTGCNSSGNAYGMVMDNSSGEHNNGAHGGCVGCIFQHNTEATIYINAEVSGFMFSGCNMDPDEDGQTCIEIVNSKRIIFDACNFMAYFKGIVNGGGLVLFNACNFRTTLDSDDRMQISGNTAVRFTSCYTDDGTEVNPV